MNSKSSTDIQAVPTNIITGFLGVGKTSAILHLLKSKPKTEHWAVLVNEFGEIGVDGGLFTGEHPQSQGVFVREVPGGCMCCTAGLPMQVALNQLLSQAKPDRLLIEPTGLGHPQEVLDVLRGEFYQDILCLQKTLTLVDARNLSEVRYSLNHTFKQQIAIADVVIGNKLDLYADGDKEKLLAYVKQEGQAHVEVAFSEQGQIDFSLLEGKASSEPLKDNHEHHHHHSHDEHDHSHHGHGHHDHHNSKQTPMASEVPIPESGFIKAVNEGEGFKSIGWRFSPSKTFEHKKLFDFFKSLRVERMKAVLITNMGIFGYNLTADALTETELDECFESRIEIISESLGDSLESQLMGCLLD